jgi:hypothetical protein
MTDHIAGLWKTGEELASQGKLHDALVSFLKAKSFLIEESKKNYNSYVSLLDFEYIVFILLDVLQRGSGFNN